MRTPQGLVKLAPRIWALFAVAWLAAAPAARAAEEDATALAKKTQNPVADLISVPFQNNFNLGVGPDDDLQYVLNVQPVIPFHLGENWNLITRTIVPLVYQPTLAPGVGDEYGLSDSQLTLFLSPSGASGLIWGLGPIFQFPTSTGAVLGAEKWGIGPSVVVLHTTGHWVYGVLANNVWSYAGDDDRPGVNQMLVQPFVNYNMDDGWYATTAPIVTANWKESAHDTWTVPVGGGVGKILRLGKLPLNVSLQTYYNVDKPGGAADWNIRLQFQFLFPR